MFVSGDRRQKLAHHFSCFFLLFPSSLFDSHAPAVPEFEMPFTVAVVYFSRHGRLVTLANVVAEGARSVRD